jgi:Amt family ammonium transporter
MGWFGFNGGSQLIVSDVESANAVARIFVNTNAAAAGGLLAALALARVLFGKSDLTLALNGALAGLVSITAEPLMPTPLVALGIGAVGGVIVMSSILVLDRLRIDDPVGAISVHGTAGLFGLIVVPFSNPDASVITQLTGAGIIFAWVFTTSVILWAFIAFMFGIRVNIKEENMGSDIVECGLEAYTAD